MLHLTSLLSPWLFFALVIGIAVGSTTHEPGRGRRITAEVWLAAAVPVLCLGLVVFHVIPGRPGLWLEIGLAMFAAHLVGCLLGHALRIPFDATVAGRLIRAEEARLAAAKRD